MDDGRLHAYLDEELAEEEREALRGHLASCAECRGRLDVAREVRARAHGILRLADPPAVEMPDFAVLRARGARAAPAMARSPGPWRQRALLLPWAASLLLALGAGWFAQELIRGSRGGGLEQVAAVRSESMEAAAPPVGAGGATQAAGVDPAAEPMAAAGEAEVADAAPPPSAPTTFQEPVGSVAEEAVPPPERVAVTGAAAPRRMAADAEQVAVTGAPAPRTMAADAARTENLAALKAQEGPAATMRAREADVQGPGAAGAAAMAPPAGPPRPSAAVGDPEWPVAWVTVNREAAAAALGAPLATIARLPVEAFQVGNVGARTAVRVLQRLPGGEIVEVLQRTGPREIELRADVTADSLARLREGVTPAPPPPSP